MSGESRLAIYVWYVLDGSSSDCSVGVHAANPNPAQGPRP